MSCGLLGAQAWALTGGAAPGIGRTARAILGMALFVPDAFSKMILGWSPLPITPSVMSLMLMVCQAYLARRKDARGFGAIPLPRHGDA